MRADAEQDLPVSSPRARGGRGRRVAAVAAVASLALLGACADDEGTGAVEPSNQEPLPAQQPEGDEDPTLSGEETPGVGDGQQGGVGSGTPDSGGMEGSVEGSPTAGEDG